MPDHGIGDIHQMEDRTGAGQGDRAMANFDAQLGKILSEERGDIRRDGP